MLSAIQGRHTIRLSTDESETRLYIHYHSERKGLFQVRIFGYSGHESLSRNFLMNTGKNRFELNCDSLPAGGFLMETIVRDPHLGNLTTYNKIKVY